MPHKIGHFDWFKGGPTGSFNATAGGVDEGYSGSSGIPDVQFGSSFNIPPWLEDLMPGNSAATDQGGFGWNMPTAMMFGQGLSGIGNLAKGWAAIKGLDVAKDSLNFKKDAFNENMQNQTSLLNNQIRDRNIFKQKTMTPGGYQLDNELVHNRIG
jgi:hypothetical protein